MSSSSIINCCVPLCNQRGTVHANGKRVGFFNFPKDPNLRAQWLQKIRRDVRTKFKLVEIKNVCSLHFRESEIKNGLGGRKMRVDVHHHSSLEICMAHFTAKETAAVCKIFTEEEQASSGRIIHVYWICFRCQLGLFGGGRSGRTHLHCTVLGLAAISYVGRLLSLLFVEIYFILGPSLGTQPELVSGAIHIHLIHKWPPTFIHSFIFSKILAISAILNSRWNKGYCIVLYCIITWDERATKHGIEAFWDKNLFSCKLWPSNWPTYVEIIAHLKAISLMRQFPDC